jgi:lipopolysaccharide biosynthesis glycosyltransferase
METVAVTFASNDDHAMLLGVALCSIFENKKGNYPVHVFVMDGGISAKNKERLGILEKRYQFAITYVVPDSRLFEKIPPAHLPMETYYRLAIARILPLIYRKVIYLDCDVVVRGDIAELFNISLDGKTVGAVADCFQDLRRENLRKLCKSLQLPEVPEKLMYFNAGVLLINLDSWRKRRIEEKLFEFIRETPVKLWLADQDALNIILLDDRKELLGKYNLIAGEARQYNEPNPFIIHFAGGDKPWYILSALPYRSEYMYYVDKTPWRNKKYRKPMDIHFAKKYHIYFVMWTAWSAYKKIRRYFAQ